MVQDSMINDAKLLVRYRKDLKEFTRKLDNAIIRKQYTALHDFTPQGRIRHTMNCATVDTLSEWCDWYQTQIKILETRLVRK